MFAKNRLWAKKMLGLILREIFCFYTLFVPRIKEGPLFVPSLNFIYSIWQDAGIRTRVAATAVRCATNELHTSLNH